ncbi:MAG: transcriptional repressor [Clostridia bacterium]
MRYSKQNEMIYKAVEASLDHPNADMLYQILKKDCPSLSLATIYRNLNKLAANGQLSRLAIPGGADRYEAYMDEHYHFMCTQCLNIYDIRIDKFEDINKTINEKTGHKVYSHNILFKGKCKNCI